MSKPTKRRNIVVIISAIMTSISFAMVVATGPMFFEWAEEPGAGQVVVAAMAAAIMYGVAALSFVTGFALALTALGNWRDKISGWTFAFSFIPLIPFFVDFMQIVQVFRQAAE